VGIEDHPLAEALEAQACRQQLRVVQLVDVRVEPQRRAQHAPRRPQHPVDASARAAHVDDVHAVGRFVAQAVGHHQGDVMPPFAQAPALLDEDPGVVARMG